MRCYNCNQEGHVTRECPLPRIPWCSQCVINTHAMEDCLELIAKWEKRTRQRGANLVNVKPWTNDGLPATNINIVTRGGKRTGEDCSTTDPPLIVKATS